MKRGCKNMNKIYLLSTVAFVIVLVAFPQRETFAADVNSLDPSTFDVRGFRLGMSFEAAKDLLSKYDKDNRMVIFSKVGHYEGSYRLETTLRNSDGSEEWYTLWFTCDKLGKRLFKVIYSNKHNTIVDPDQFAEKLQTKYRAYTDSCRRMGKRGIETFMYTWGFPTNESCGGFSFYLPSDRAALKFEVTLYHGAFESEQYSESDFTLNDGVLDSKNDEETKKLEEKKKMNEQKRETEKLKF